MLWMILFLQTANCQPLTFGIYRSTLLNQGDINVYQIFTQQPTTSAPYIDGAVILGKHYYYAVRANCTINGVQAVSVPTAELDVIANGPIKLIWDYSQTIPLSALPPPTGLAVACAMDAKTAVLRWNNLQNATGYYLRIEQSGMTEAYNQLPGNSYLATVIPNAHYTAWLHGWNPSYPPADPSFPSGVGYSAYFPNFTCIPPTPPMDIIKPSVN